MKPLLKRCLVPVYIAFALLLFAKYFWSYFEFPGVPFGYDAGIYRYLFITHARGFPPFDLAALPPWAAVHPLGLFFFSSIALKLGVPADALIGWFWNLFPILLAGALSWVFYKSAGRWMGAAVLLVALVSVVQYQGFLMIYWKVFAALLWCTFAFFSYERRSPLWILFGMLTVATHQQIGLIFGLAIVSSIIVKAVTQKKPWPALKDFGLFLVSGVLGMLWYLPNYSESIGSILPLLSRPAVGLGIFAVLAFGVLIMISFLISANVKWWILAGCIVVGFLLLLLPFSGNAPSSVANFLAKSRSTDPGAFLSVEDYLRLSSPLLLLGIFGLGLFFRQNPGSPWVFAAIWPGLAVISMFFFYRRFILPLDFFLIPLAAMSLVWMWRHKKRAVNVLAIIVLAAQGGLLLYQMRTIDPHVEARTLKEFALLADAVTPGSSVVVLDNMTPWVVGFLPDAKVSGPGIFDSLPLDDWKKFLFGNHGERLEFFDKYPAGTYFYATDVFRTYYPPEVQSLLQDPCLKPAGAEGLYVLSFALFGCQWPESAGQ